MLYRIYIKNELTFINVSQKVALRIAGVVGVRLEPQHGSEWLCHDISLDCRMANKPAQFYYCQGCKQWVSNRSEKELAPTSPNYENTEIASLARASSNEAFLPVGCITNDGRLVTSP